jgi:hypothetical protein
MARRRVTLDLDAEVASTIEARLHTPRSLRARSSDRTIRAIDLRALVARIRERSDLDEDAALRLAGEELRAVRSERAA